MVEPTKSNSLEERSVVVQEENQKLAREKFEYKRSKSVLANVSVIVTIIAAVSAVLFQVGAFWTAEQQAQTAATNENAARIQAQKEWEFRGVELFVNDEDKILICDATTVNSQVRLFASLFPEISRKFSDVAAAKANACAAERARQAAEQAIDKKSSPQAVQEAANQARYTVLEAFSPSASANQVTATKTALPTVYIQIASESQRSIAMTLQQDLHAHGYNTPAVERVAAAPRQPQIRYFYKGQQNEALQLGDLIEQTLHIAKPAVEMVPGHYADLPSGTMEFWFGSASQ